MTLQDLERQIQVEKNRHDRALDDLSRRKQAENDLYKMRIRYFQDLKLRIKYQTKNENINYNMLREELEKYL